jgi:hypothetical protein
MGTKIRPRPNEKRPRETEPSSPDGAGNEIRTHDFNLGKGDGRSPQASSCVQNSVSDAGITPESLRTIARQLLTLAEQLERL